MTQLFIDFARSKMKMTINGAYDFVEGYKTRPVMKSIEDTFEWLKEYKLL